MLELLGDATSDDVLHVVRVVDGASPTEVGDIIYRVGEWFFVPKDQMFNRDDLNRLITLLYCVKDDRSSAIRSAVSGASSVARRQLRMSKPLGDTDDVLG